MFFLMDSACICLNEYSFCAIMYPMGINRGGSAARTEWRNGTPMKTVRQMARLDILAKQDVETQEELAEALRARGIQVTQATVSRDIKELRLLKVLTPSGSYKYATADKAENGLSERFIRMLAESLLSVAASNNLIVVKTLSGSANVAAEALDSLHWPEILGTLAGDNTILLIIRTEAEAPDVVRRIQEMIK